MHISALTEKKHPGCPGAEGEVPEESQKTDSAYTVSSHYYAFIWGHPEYLSPIYIQNHK